MDPIKNIIKSILIDISIATLLFVIDIFDVPSRIIFNSSTNVLGYIDGFFSDNLTYVNIIVIALLIIIILSIVLQLKRFTEVVCCRLVNNVDIFIANSGVVCLILMCFYIVAGGSVLYRVNILVIAQIIAIVWFAIRRIATCVLRRKQKPSDIATIADLYNNNLPKGPGFLFVEDTEASEDIIGRELIIDKLYNLATSNARNKSLTVSLVGPWGSGKSSILKCLKKKIEGNKTQNKRIIFIDSFNPWNYDDAEVMARSFAKTVLDKLGLKSDNRAISELVNSFLQTIPDQYISGFFSRYRFKGKMGDPIGNINKYLFGHNKQLVIVLDNLERGDPKMIIKLLKAIKNNLGLKSTIFILSYDDIVLNEILPEENIDRKYLDKFSQLNIRVPDITSERKKEITKKCIKNYLSRTGEDSDQLDEVSNRLSGSIATPRDLVLVINSIYSGRCIFLNPSDTLIMDIISRKAPNLYDEIRRNLSYYTYNESVAHPELYSSYGDNIVKNYCSAEISYFNKIKNESRLKGEVASCRAYLTYLFPHISQFLDGNDDNSLIALSTTAEAIRDAKKNRRMRVSGNAVVYFTRSKNGHIEAVDIVDRLVRDDSETVRDSLFRYIRNATEEIEELVLQQLEERLDELRQETIDYVAVELAKNLMLFKRGETTKWFSSRDKACSFLNALLFKISEKPFWEILNYFGTGCEHLETLHTLEYWSRTMTDRPRNYNDRYNAILGKLNQVKETIINENVNLYAKNTYRRYSCKLIGERKTVIDYIQRIKNKVPKKNRVLIIADAIYKSSSTDGTIHYEIDDEFLNSALSEDEIRNAIDSAKTSKLKNAIKTIVKHAIKGGGPSLAPNSRSYSSKEDYDLTLFTEEYVSS